MELLSRLVDSEPVSDVVEKLHLELVKPNRVLIQPGATVAIRMDGGLVGRWPVIVGESEVHKVELVVNLLSPGRLGRVALGWELGEEVLLELFDSPVRFGDGQYELVGIAEGMGIVVLKGLVEREVRQQRNRPMRLYWGLETHQELFWEEELNQLREETKSLEVDIVLGRPPLPEWKLCSGRVDDCLVAHRVVERGNQRFVVSGSEQMILRMRRLLGERGIGDDLVAEVMIA